MKKTILGIASLALIIGLAGIVSADVNPVTPSTNDINKVNEWAYVDEISVDVGEVTLEFISTRAFYSCFEYRTDGDTSQVIGVNYNTDITDGLYPYYCQNNNDRTETITANEYVEIRMVFGAETDERFDWTRFDVDAVPTKAEILMNAGVPGKGLENAPGLQKPFNPKSQAAENAGKKK